MNNAHNGKWLGQALFKIVDQVGIAHKVRSGAILLLLKIWGGPQIGHVTCDNASNNNIIMQEFATHLEHTTGK